MFLRIVFLFVFFPLSQGQADSSKKFDCEHEAGEAFTYRFDPTKIEEKIEPVKRLANTFGGELTPTYTDDGDEPHFSREEVEKERTVRLNLSSQRDASKCFFNKKNAENDAQQIVNNCQFEEIHEICAKVESYTFEKTCGNKKPCDGGLFIEAKNMAEAKRITPENLGLVMDKRNEIARTLIDFKKRYEKCASLVRKHILHNNDHDGLGMNLCTDAYDLFINNKGKEMTAKNCSIRSINDYEKRLKELMGKTVGGIYQKIKNSHVMARVCTLKLLSVFNQLDEALDNFDPKRKTASQEVPLAN